MSAVPRRDGRDPRDALQGSSAAEADETNARETVEGARPETLAGAGAENFGGPSTDDFRSRPAAGASLLGAPAAADSVCPSARPHAGSAGHQTDGGPSPAGQPSRDGVPAPIDAMRNNQLTLIWSRELKRAFGEDKHAAKKIARRVDVNTRTAENWLYGVNTPDLLNALKLMAKVPALASETRRLIGMSADLDPELERDFHALFRTWSQVKERGR